MTNGTNSDAGVFGGLVSLWIAQNQLMWSRIQTQFALQVAALAAAYATRGTEVVATVILALAGLLTLLVFLLMERDREVRDVHGKLLDSLGLKFKKDRFRVRPTHCQLKHKAKGRRLAFVRGSCFQWISSLALIALDAVMVIVIWRCPQLLCSDKAELCVGLI